MTVKWQQSGCRSRVEKARKTLHTLSVAAGGYMANGLAPAESACAIATAMPLATPTVRMKPFLLEVSVRQPLS